MSLISKDDAISRKVVLDKIKEVCFSRKQEWVDFRVSYGSNGQRDLIIKFIESLPSIQPRSSISENPNKWIPVSERLPEPRVDVWVNSDIGQIQGYYEEHIGIWYASFGQGRDYLELIVNAWMPLPEPYKNLGIENE